MRRITRTVTLLMILLLVACIGLVIGSTGPEPTPTESALIKGAEAAEELAVAARALAAAPDPPEAAGFEPLAAMLERHAAALRPARDFPEAAPSFFASVAAETPAPGPTEPAAPSPRRLLGDLAKSYTDAFSAAGRIERGPARLLASAATAQWLQARALAASIGASPPAVPVADIRYGDDPPGCPVESTVEPTPGLDGTRTAVLAEHRASYVYEVVAARASDPEPYLARKAEHERAAAAGSAVLLEHCLAEPLPSVAYALDPGFLTQPDRSLQELESSLVGTYADLVGVSAPGTVRDWAIRQLAVTSQRVADSGGATLPGGEPAFPGIDNQPFPRLTEPGS